MKAPELLIGITGNGVVHTDRDDFSVDTRFRMVKEAGVFDYYDKTPPTGELDAYVKASQKYGLPVLAGGFYYTLKRDEPLLEWHLRMARELGTRDHNVQILTRDAEGNPVTNEEVSAVYQWAAEIGDKYGVTPCLEVHVNMWSEHFGRVEAVGNLVEQSGIPFSMTLDHSHVVFKMDNPREQEVQGMNEEVAAGKLVLDPRLPGNVIGKWIERNWVRHAHARPAVPDNPRNIWARHPDGSPGRGIQYPFKAPPPDAWHSEWNEANLDPWKSGVRALLGHHATNPASRLRQISTEIIPATDYGAGARYSLFEDSVACASWIRAAWDDARAQARP